MKKRERRGSVLLFLERVLERKNLVFRKLKKSQKKKKLQKNSNNQNNFGWERDSKNLKKKKANINIIISNMANKKGTPTR